MNPAMRPVPALTYETATEEHFAALWRSWPGAPPGNDQLADHLARLDGGLPRNWIDGDLVPAIDAEQLRTLTVADWTVWWEASGRPYPYLDRIASIFGGREERAAVEREEPKGTARHADEEESPREVAATLAEAPREGEGREALSRGSSDQESPGLAVEREEP